MSERRLAALVLSSICAVTLIALAVCGVPSRLLNFVAPPVYLAPGD